jgi:hypothetical protein
MKQGTALRQLWRKRYTSMLDMIFQEYESASILINPDEAMELMEKLLPSVVGKELQPNKPKSLRFDVAAYRREAHHYAVGRFYKTFYGSRRGAPPLSLEYLDHVLKLQAQGLNHAQIAKRLGQTKDTIRKQLKQAVRLWNERANKIRELSIQAANRRSPE